MCVCVYVRTRARVCVCVRAFTGKPRTSDLQQTPDSRHVKSFEFFALTGGDPSNGGTP